MSQYHVYSLPVELVQTLTPRNLINAPSQPSKPASPEPPEITAPSGPRTCNICQGATFIALEDQRAHFRSDWHRYNVKTRLAGGKPVTESAFTQLVDALEDSLSGSESSDESDSSESDAVNNLVSKAKRKIRLVSPDEERKPNTPQTALTWFHSPPSTQIGVYRALYSDPKDTSKYLDELREMQHSSEEGRQWAMFMVAGGHFAGAIVQVSRQSENEGAAGKNGKNKLQKPRSDTEVLRHKTFHRYTTRRKQGGSQSLNDNAKGNAKSAGALLRRYGEQSLRDDIRNLLLEWREDIDACERIWIRASGSNRKIFIGYDDAVIPKGDDRLRTFPFPTRRPTQSELARCLLELTRVKVTHFTEEALREQDEIILQSLPKPRPVPTVAPPEPEKPKPVKLTKEEELLREKWARLLEMVTKGRLEPLKAFWEREATNIGSIDVRIPEWTGERKVTLLQVAAQAGHEDVVHWFLEEARADPTIPVMNPKSDDPDDDVDDRGSRSDASDTPKTLPKGSRRTAYDLARSKGVRDVFRRCAAVHPDWWDWLGAGRVPSTLSQQMEQVQEDKKKERRKGLKDKVREREAREREKEKELPPSPPVQEAPRSSIRQSNLVSNRLGGSSGAGEGVAGLTPEMRARVERERRARAAEARMKTLGSR